MKRKLIKAADLALASLLPSVDRASDRLVVLAFHAVLPDLSALEAEAIDPYQPLTLADVEAVITELKGRGYRFITGRGIAAGAVTGPAVWLTFDDGYANNLALVPLLKRLDACATIFVATHYVETGEAYWWDVFYRESLRQGVDPGQIAAQREALKAQTPARIRAELTERFGAEALRPIGEIDRPMTPQELAGLADVPQIEIGNHTHDHTILPTVDVAAQEADIARCQQRLQAMTGQTPVSIAYPNGDITPETPSAAMRVGLSVGVTCAPHQHRFGSGGGRSMQIGRFAGLRHGVMRRELRLATARVRLLPA